MNCVCMNCKGRGYEVEEGVFHTCSHCHGDGGFDEIGPWGIWGGERIAGGGGGPPDRPLPAQARERGMALKVRKDGSDR